MALEKFTGASRGVALGKALEGKSALSSFLEGLSDRMQQQDLINMQIGGQVALKKATLPLEEKSQERLFERKAEIQRQTNADFLKGFQGKGLGNLTVGGDQEGNLQVSGMTISPKGSSLQLSNPSVKRRPIPSQQISAISQTNETIARLEDLLNTVNRTPMATGPFAGRFQRGPIANAYIQTVGSPGEVDFKGKAERFLNSYLTAETGVQRGFKEIQFLSTAVPNPAVDNPTNFKRKAQSALSEIKQKRNRMLRILQEGGYNVGDIQNSLRSIEVPEGFERIE